MDHMWIISRVGGSHVLNQSVICSTALTAVDAGLLGLLAVVRVIVPVFMLWHIFLL